MTEPTPLAPEPEVPSPPRMSVLSIVGDSGAVMISSIAAILAGLLRTKFAAVEIGPGGVAVLAQLSQLYVLILTVSIIGLGTGMRVVLARMRVEREADGLAKVLITAATLVSVVAAVAVILAAAPIAGALLDDSGDAGWVRIAALSVPFAVALQTASAAVQARGEFRALAGASIVGGVLAAIATVLLMLPGEITLAVVSLPVAAALQLLPLFFVTPTGRRLVRAGWHARRPQLKEIVQIGAITFGLAVTSSLLDTVLRGRMVHVGGLDLVAELQPGLVLSNQAFGLVLGALTATVLVRMTSQIAAEPERDQTEAFNAIARRLLLLLGVVAFSAQALSGLFVVVLFSDDFLSSTPILAALACGDLLRAFGWIFGAMLLPQKRQLGWALMGLVIVLAQFVLAWFLLPEYGAAGYVGAYITAWVIGAVAVVVALAGSSVRVQLRSILLVAVLFTVLVLSALVVYDDPGRVVYLAPLVGAVALIVAILATHRARGGRVLSQLRSAATGSQQ